MKIKVRQGKERGWCKVRWKTGAMSFYLDLGTSFTFLAPMQDNCTETIQGHYQNKACPSFHHDNFLVLFPPFREKQLLFGVVPMM